AGISQWRSFGRCGRAQAQAARTPGEDLCRRRRGDRRMAGADGGAARPDRPACARPSRPRCGAPAAGEGAGSGYMVRRSPARRRPSSGRGAADHRCERRDGVLKLGEKQMSLAHSIHVVNHPLVQHKLTKMRDKETSSTNFRRLLREMGLPLGYDATRDLPLVEREISTPIATMNAPLLEGKKLVVVPILRAGLGLAEGIIDLVPLARVGHVGLYRDPKTLQAVEYYFKIPQDISDRDVIVCDPMLATAHSAIAAVDRLKESGAKRIKFICVLGSEQGARAFAEVHPDVPVF